MVKFELFCRECEEIEIYECEADNIPTICGFCNEGELEAMEVTK